MINQTILINIFTIYIRISSALNTNEDSKLNFTGLGFKYGHNVEEHNVITEDGYILKLYHIPGNDRRPVLLVHGIIDSSDTFIIRGNGSLAITLVNRGYDIWAINTRGNRCSKLHEYLNPNDGNFWNFSFHEMGYYDLPATIDYILERTNQKQLTAIGHSQGNTLFYVLGSTRPEYNEKIKVMIALAPICFLHNVKPPVSTLLELLPTVGNLLQTFGMEEVFSDEAVYSGVIKSLCNQKEVGYEVCARGVFFAIGGSDSSEFEPEFLPVVVSRYPTSTSRKNGVHVAQVALRRSFSQYDYGPMRNIAVYNTIVPPLYDLGKVKMRVVLFVGRNDGMSSIRDTELLRDRLPNVEYRLLEHKKLNHLDHVWGRNMDQYLFPHILSVLKKYN
ncbi:PREDICTED: lipase 1-like [Papilio polytes]|uniref:lipase 1-like n=1 Tax=Papilio polytes TaxID=76194 RepID=UPI0006767010|nr:PREDICTED: lipase 1-like [Papilio polytes]